MDRTGIGFVCVTMFSSLLAAQVDGIDIQRLRAHERFLSSDALGGRASATRDEQIAATYVGSQFESLHLQADPLTAKFTQQIELLQPELDGHARLLGSQISMEEQVDFRLMASSGGAAKGILIRADPNNLKSLKVTGANAVLFDFQSVSPDQVFSAVIAAHSAGAELILLMGGDALEKELGGMPDAIRSHYADGTRAQIGIDVGTVVLLRQAAANKIRAVPDGSLIEIVVKVMGTSHRATYNAIGLLPGTDPNAGTILLTAHLDHLGKGEPVNGDSIYNGADDDASGVVSVLELARVLSSGRRLRRSLLFVCFGSEELGGYGSTWFEHHLPVPFSQIVADLNFEQVGLSDPKMPKGMLMVNGWERSDLGAALRLHGAKLGPDPYPEMHLFESSDNFGFAKQGVIAHTFAGYALPPTHHRPDDDFDHLDFPFLTQAIQSLVEPIRWLAHSNFRPEWKAGMKP